MTLHRQILKAPGLAKHWGQSCSRTSDPSELYSLAKEYIIRAHKQPNTKALSMFRALDHPKEEKGIEITTKMECSTNAEGKGLRDQLVLI